MGWQGDMRRVAWEEGRVQMTTLSYFFGRGEGTAKAKVLIEKSKTRFCLK